MFLCLRGVCVSWLKWKLPETAPTPPLFLAFVFTEGMKLGQHSGEGGWVSALGDRGGGRDKREKSLPGRNGVFLI